MEVRIQQDAHLFSYRLATNRNKKPETKERASICSGTPDKRNRETLRSSQKYQIEPTGTRFGTVRTTGLRSMEHASCQTEAPDKTSRNPLSTIRKAETRKVKCASHQPGTLVYELQIRMAGNAERTTMQNETRRLDFSTVMVRNRHVLPAQFEEHEV